jgi:hypothetical protein
MDSSIGNRVYWSLLLCCNIKSQISLAFLIVSYSSNLLRILIHNPASMKLTTKIFGPTQESLDAQACHSSHFLVQEPDQDSAVDGAPRVVRKVRLVIYTLITIADYLKLPAHSHAQW